MYGNLHASSTAPQLTRARAHLVPLELDDPAVGRAADGPQLPHRVGPGRVRVGARLAVVGAHPRLVQHVP